jgi:hypothetical protein
LFDINTGDNVKAMPEDAWKEVGRECVKFHSTKAGHEVFYCFKGSYFLFYGENVKISILTAKIPVKYLIFEFKNSIQMKL